MRIQEVVGERVRERREVLGLTQQQLGERLAPHLGRTWSRQAVSAAEKGGRDFAAAELVALGLVLDVMPAALLTPAAIETVELPGGTVLSAQQMLLLFLMPGDRGSSAGMEAIAQVEAAAERAALWATTTHDMAVAALAALSAGEATS